MNSKKLLFAVLFVLGCAFGSFGQIVYQHDFGTTTITAHPYTVAPTTLDTNLNTSSWSNSTSAWTSFAGAAGQAISLNNSSGTPTVTLTFNVAAGFQLSVTDFDIWTRRSTTGAQNWSMTINGISIGSGTVSTGGSSTGTTAVSNAVSNQTGTITVVISLSGASGTGTFRLDDFTLFGTVTPTVTGIISANNGLWNVGATWVGGVVPLASQNAIINHAVTLNANVTRNAGTTTTVNSGKGILTSSYTYTNNGTTNVDGYITLQNGGYVGGANNLVYSGTTSALNFSQNTAIPYVVSAGQRFWPVANPPYNVNVTSNSPAQLNMVVGAVEGQIALSAGIDIVTANALTVNGTLRINLFGFVNTNAPIYGASSRLLYASGGTYGRGYEWNSLGVGTIGVTPGYPNNVYIQGNTAVDYVNTAVPNVVGIKAIAGNLDIITGSALNMDTGSVPTGGAFIVGGTVAVSGPSGAFRLGVGANDDLKVGGSFIVSSTAVFDGKQRKVFFTNNVLQDISGPSLTIPYLVCEPSSGSSMLRLNGALTAVTISAPLGGNAITFNGAGDTFDLNARALTIGTAGVANVISGAGTFRGSTTSSLSLLGTGSVGTLTFSGTTAQQSVGTFTVNRTAGAVACVMGSDLTVATAMSLTAGIVDINASTVTLNAATSLTGASSSNYFIADNAFGGVLRKGYTTTTSFTFPIGEKTGTMEYSPATLNLTSGTGMNTASFIGMSVNDMVHPNMPPAAHSISRYWPVTKYGTINAPVYTFTGTYLLVDVNGTETSSLSQYWTGTAWSAVGTFLFGNTLSYGGANALPTSGSYDFTGGLRDREINIKQGATNYLTGSTYTFAPTPATTFIDVTFTIENLGNASLTIFANPTVTSGGAFSLNPLMPSNVTVTGLGTTTFTIRFLPLTAGPFTGSISIVNNDSDENPYVINFSGTGTGSTTSDIIGVAASEPLNIPSTTIGTIATITDGIEAWRFLLRDGGTVASDADALATTMTDLVITQSAGDQIGNWNESIEDIVLVNLLTNTIVAHGVVTTNQIQFNTISVVAADNTQLTLGLRLTLKCPLGVGAIDGDDFGFTITNANTTFAPTGSGKIAFAARNSTNSRNIIAVVATKLTFTTQPITTGVSIAMTNVVVSATDACGNRDINRTGTVALTSSGTMSPVTSVSLSSGSATFTGITHTVVGTDFYLTATTAGLPLEWSTLFDISTITILNKGDLAVLAVNTNTTVASGTDEVAFVCFRDLLPGTQLFITDNGYERQFAGQWGGTEGVITITRTGSLLPKGTILTIRTTTANASSGSHFDVYSCGAVDTNWTKSVIGGSGFNLNSDDDIYFMQGGVWTNNTGHTSTYTGNVLYAWTESGWDLAPGGSSQSPQWSTLYPGMECFSTIAPTGNGFVKFDDPINPDFSTTTNGKFDWIGLINSQTNWNSYTDNANYVANGFNYASSCTLVNLATSTYVNGRWNGKADTNWFNCLNWETLIVPTASTNVVIPDTTYDRQATIDATAPFASYLGFVAKTNNLTITGERVEIIGNINNKLEVHGNLLIGAGTGTLDMDDGTAAADGELYLYGNWTNNMGNAAFDEGDGTVIFRGTAPQIINNVTPLGTEIFKNVVLNNDFDTAVSNDLFATGNLTLNATKTLDIDAAGYVNVYNTLTSNGNVVIQSNGQLLQVNDTDTNAGTYTGTTFRVRRNYTAKDIDYVYWGSPTKLFGVSNLPNGNRYQWNPTITNGNGTQGNWIVPSTANMVDGKGYIARTFNGSTSGATLPFSFYGKPNNGTITVSIARGAYTGADYDAEPANPNNVDTSRWDDNWNLVGNPYPSAIKAMDFLTSNTNIEGFINIWTHLTAPSSTIDPFYYNFGYNYTPADYITYNGTGTIGGPTGFNGIIASGQGFFVLMNDGAATTGSIFFNNAMRSDIASKLNYNNSQFYRTSSDNDVASDEKNRIWLDIISQTNQIDRTLVGYVTNATNDTDRLYDALTKPAGLKIYSFSDDNTIQPLCIQGKGLPFMQDDKIKLGFRINTAGTYKIAIGAVDGLFTDNQDIYLEDKLLNVIYDLREAPYTFTAQKGIFNDRFVLRYTTESLGNSNFDNPNQIIVTTNHSLINVVSNTETISQVQLFDMLGREIYAMDNLETLTYSIANIINNQALIIKVTLTNGAIVSKKIIVN